jgi:hypothetical protein
VVGGTQPGLGRAVGGWAEAATDFLRASPPPGRMLNMGPDLGDDVIFWVPGLPVFVDSRLESYPPELLAAELAAETSDADLLRLADRFDVQWAFMEHARAAVRARALGLLRRGWRPVYTDSAYLVLVRPGPSTAAYIAAHAIDLATARPADLVAAPVQLRDEQEATFASFIAAVRGAGLR